MTHRLILETAAINAAAGFLADDPDGLQAALQAIDRLTDDPQPEGSAPFGSPDMRRLHANRYRALHRISDDTITIINLGRTAL